MGNLDYGLNAGFEFRIAQFTALTKQVASARLPVLNWVRIFANRKGLTGTMHALFQID
jgi:hypothetical protein